MDTEKKAQAAPKKRGEGKKPGKPQGPPDMRGRAKSTLVNPFEKNKTGGASKKENKPVETIGNDRFKNLLSMFDKKPEQGKENNEDPGPKKLDANKFSAFNGGNNAVSGKQSQGMPKAGVADSIQKRMEALLNSNKNNRNTVAGLDPVLEQRRKQLEEEYGDEEEDDLGDDHFDDDLSDLSEKKSDKDDDSFSDSESEKKEEPKEQEAKVSEEKKEEEEAKGHDDSQSLSDDQDKLNEDKHENALAKNKKENSNALEIPETKIEGEQKEKHDESEEH